MYTTRLEQKDLGHKKALKSLLCTENMNEGGFTLHYILACNHCSCSSKPLSKLNGS